MQAEVDARVVREVDPLQEQVRLYAETVGILVGEKTELQSALNRSQQLAKSKAGMYLFRDDCVLQLHILNCILTVTEDL